MKKLIVASVLALGFLGTSAQTKIGYINSDALMAAMPETQSATKVLQDYEKSLGDNYNDLEKEANDKSAQFVKDSITMAPSKKEVVRAELIKLISRVQNYQQEAQDLMKKKQQELLAPIQQKAAETIKTVAKKNGYSYVFDETVLFVKPDGDNLLPLVKKELNIVDAPVKSTTPAKGGN